METIAIAQIQNRFSRALTSYDEHAEAQQRICKHLIEQLIHTGGRRYRRLLEIGCGTGGFTRLLKSHCVIDEWIINDLCEGCRDKISPLFAGHLPHFMPGDAEEIQPKGKFDLIASASVFQWMKNPEQFFKRLASWLVPGGILAFNTFASGNMQEIKELTGKGLTYPTRQQLINWLSDEFELCYMAEESILLHFKTPLHVLKHLKATGVTATGNGIWTRSMQDLFCRQYVKLYSTSDNQVQLTYQPLYVVAVKK